MISDKIFDELRDSNDRLEIATKDYDRALAHTGLQPSSEIISGEEAIAAALELQAASQEQSEIIRRLLAAAEDDPDQPLISLE